MIRDVTGLNEARDGSNPDKDTLLGLQKMAANASNVATRHISNAANYLTLRTCENVSLKIADVLNFPLTKNSLMQSISVFNSEVLKEIEQLNLFDFGIYLELEPEEEDIAQLEQNIQIALKTGNIDLDDVIDIREIKNIKLANEVLKIRKKKKQEAAQKAQLANIQAQAQANAQATEQSALVELQKQQALTQEKVNIEQAKSQFEIQRLQTEAQIKKELMVMEFEYNMQLAEARAKAEKVNIDAIEERKDKRIKMQGTQQSELIDQRKNDTLPKNFESAGNDVLGGFNLEQFSPK